MKGIHVSPLLFVAAICSIMIPFFMWAQEAEVNGPYVPPSGFVMKFERMSGYSGVHDSFWIYSDGRVINGDGRSAEIPPGTVMEWQKNITPVASKASAEFSMESWCMDCFAYLVTIYDEERTRTIRLPSLLQGSSEEGASTFLRMRDRLLHIVWSRPMSASSQIPEEKRPIKREPIRIGGNVLESKLIFKVDPIYPDQAKSARLSGKVILSVTVDEEAMVSDVKVESGDPILAESAAAAIKQWRFRPTLLNGEPVRVTFAVTVLFSFSEGGSIVRVRTMNGRIESDIKALYGIGIHYHLWQFRETENPAVAVRAEPYVLYEGRKYYTVMLGISPPQLSLNRPKLRKLADQGWPGSGIDAGAILLYRIFINEGGEISGIRRLQGPQIPEVETELAGTPIAAPARRASDPVPVWIAIEIAIP